MASGLKPSLHSSAGFVHIFTASSENHIAPSMDLAFFNLLSKQIYEIFSKISLDVLWKCTEEGISAVCV